MNEYAHFDKDILDVFSMPGIKQHQQPQSSTTNSIIPQTNLLNNISQTNLNSIHTMTEVKLNEDVKSGHMNIDDCFKQSDDNENDVFKIGDFENNDALDIDKFLEEMFSRNKDDEEGLLPRPVTTIGSSNTTTTAAMPNITTIKESPSPVIQQQTPPREPRHHHLQQQPREYYEDNHLHRYSSLPPTLPSSSPSTSLPLLPTSSSPSTSACFGMNKFNVNPKRNKRAGNEEMEEERGKRRDIASPIISTSDSTMIKTKKSLSLPTKGKNREHIEIEDRGNKTFIDYNRCSPSSSSSAPLPLLSEQHHFFYKQHYSGVGDNLMTKNLSGCGYKNGKGESDVAKSDSECTYENRKSEKRKFELAKRNHEDNKRKKQRFDVAEHEQEYIVSESRGFDLAKSSYEDLRSEGGGFHIAECSDENMSKKRRFDADKCSYEHKMSKKRKFDIASILGDEDNKEIRNENDSNNFNSSSTLPSGKNQRQHQNHLPSFHFNESSAHDSKYHPSRFSSHEHYNYKHQRSHQHDNKETERAVDLSQKPRRHDNKETERAVDLSQKPRRHDNKETERAVDLSQNTPNPRPSSSSYSYSLSTPMAAESRGCPVYVSLPYCENCNCNSCLETRDIVRNLSRDSFYNLFPNGYKIKRGRGRPRKTSVENFNALISSSSTRAESAIKRRSRGGARGRGRQREISTGYLGNSFIENSNNNNNNNIYNSNRSDDINPVVSNNNRNGGNCDVRYERVGGGDEGGNNIISAKYESMQRNHFYPLPRENQDMTTSEAIRSQISSQMPL